MAKDQPKSGPLGKRTHMPDRSGDKRDTSESSAETLILPDGVGGKAFGRGANRTSKGEQGE